MHDEATRQAYPFLATLEAAFGDIRAEATALDTGWLDMPGYPDLLVYLLDAGEWGDGYPPVDFDAHRAACPRTMAVVEQIPGVEVAGFLKLPPGVTMRPHTDPRDDDLVRAHLGLQLPVAEQAWWPEGKARLMDPRQLHWARNDSPLDRLTFVVDVRVPFVVPDGAFGPWRPDPPPPTDAR